MPWGTCPASGWDEDGKTVVNTTLPPTHAGDYWERRQESVLKALTDYAKVEVCLIGIGERPPLCVHSR